MAKSPGPNGMKATKKMTQGPKPKKKEYMKMEKQTIRKVRRDKAKGSI